MKGRELMKNPYYAAMLMQIESCIHERDRETREGGDFVPKDSLVKSALRKAELAAGGKKAARKPKGRDEEWIAALAAEIVAVGRESEIPPVRLAAALKATQQSLDTRREMGGHSRGYLDFLEEFMRDAKGGA